MIEWKIKGLYKADAEAVYQEIASLGSKVTPEQIVEYAKDKSTELNKCFTWNNAEAAKKYRIIQAQAIIRNISVTVDYNDDNGEQKQVKCRAIVCTNENKNQYEPISRCIENPDSFARLKATFLKDLLYFKERYERYSKIKAEYSDLFDAVDSAIQAE